MTSTPLGNALAGIPKKFRDRLLAEYDESQRAAATGDWEKVGLKAGKICEISYCILEGVCTGTYPASILKPRNMQDACKALESTSATIPRTARIQIPKLIATVYELRNHRAIGHAGGDVLPNQMDGLLFNQSIKWIIAEFVRLFHNVSLEEATKLVDQLSFRWTAAIWQTEGRKRVLVEGLDTKQQILTLLYFSDMRATLDQLRDWLDVGNITHFKDRQLAPLHSDALVDYDQKLATVHLLPNGAKKVEVEILTKLAPT